jgi:hypothetical protein
MSIYFFVSLMYREVCRDRDRYGQTIALLPGQPAGQSLSSVDRELFWNAMANPWIYFGTNSNEYTAHLREFKRRKPWAQFCQHEQQWLFSTYNSLKQLKQATNKV